MRWLRYAKGIAAAVFTLIGTLMMLIQAAIADESISFEEANGIWLAFTAALTTIGVTVGVVKTKNRR